MSSDHHLSSISDTVLDMCTSAYHALAFANALMFYRDIVTKHRLEVELKIVKGFLEIALAQLESEDFTESEV